MYVIVECVRNMETVLRFRKILILSLAAGMLFGLNSVSASDELFFNNIIEISDTDNGKRTIEVDASGNIFASFGTILYKLSDSGTVLEERTFFKRNYFNLNLTRLDKSRIVIEVWLKWRRFDIFAFHR